MHKRRIQLASKIEAKKGLRSGLAMEEEAAQKKAQETRGHLDDMKELEGFNDLTAKKGDPHQTKSREKKSIW